MSVEPEREKSERQEAEERKAPPGSVVYESVREEGEGELERGTAALAWSGLAAGLSMGFTFLAESILRHHLPESDWRILVTKFGYSFGFLIVILGRQQLFTENTLTVILPFLVRKKVSILTNIGRLWSVVLVTNLIGAFLFAAVLARTSVVDADLQNTLRTVAEESMKHDFATTLIRGVFAGWLIALMVWLLPFAESFRVIVIILITYLIGIGEFPHIIAGAVAVFHLLASGSATAGDVFGGYIAPTLIGNIIGGVTLVALLGHAQFAAHGERS